MKISDLKTLNLKAIACISAIVFAPSITFAGGTNSTIDDKSATGQSQDPNAEMNPGDMGANGVGQTNKPSSVLIDDATLDANLKAALKDDPTLSKLEIGSVVSNGAVTLTGVAGDPRWSARATTVARSVVGVQSVQNNMTIGH